MNWGKYKQSSWHKSGDRLYKPLVSLKKNWVSGRERDY